MNEGKYIFGQIVDFIPQRQFRRMVARAVQDKTRDWALSHWNHLLLLISGQLNGCNTMLELVSIVEAHSKKAYALGFGDAFSLTSLSRANAQRDCRVFEGFSYYMVELADLQKKGVLIREGNTSAIPFNNPFPPQKTDSEQLSTHRTCSTKILSFRDSALVGKNQK